MDLESAVLALALTEYPDADPRRCSGLLDALAQGVRAELAGAEPPEIVGRLSHHLFEREGFRGDTKDFEDPDNSYFNKVLERRRGIPITLCAVLILVGRRLGLPIVGVGMPSHFLAKYWDDRHEIFIDPFGGGTAFSRAEAGLRLVEAGFGFQPRFLEPATTGEIVERMVHNLALIYRKRGDRARLERLKRFSGGTK